MEIETLSPLYFNDEVIVKPSYDIYKVETSKGRYYYTMEDGVRFYISVTNILSRFTPTPSHLIKWIAQHGEEGADKIKNRRAAYGTLMHDTIEDLIIDGGIDLDKLPERVDGYFEENDIWDASRQEFTDELYKDITAFAQFMIDKKVKPIAVEVVIKSDRFNVAGAVDLLCTLEFRKKRRFAIIDFKSSKKNFYENNEIQLEYYKQAVLETWPSFKEEDIMLFNWSGKDWRSSPAYNLKNQTNLHSENEIELYSKLYKEKTKSNPVGDTQIVDFNGKISLGKGDISENYSVQTLKEKLK